MPNSTKLVRTLLCDLTCYRGDGRTDLLLRGNFRGFGELDLAFLPLAFRLLALDGFVEQRKTNLEIGYVFLVKNEPSLVVDGLCNMQFRKLRGVVKSHAVGSTFSRNPS